MRQRYQYGYLRCVKRKSGSFCWEFLSGAFWSNETPAEGAYVIEDYGRHEETRTPDLYRVKVAL